MASLVDYGAALRFVQTRAQALGLGFVDAHPRALFTCLRTSLPILSEPCDAFRRPSQIRAHARVLAQCEELMVTVAAALHSRDARDEERAVAEARKLCRLLVELESMLGLYGLDNPWPKRDA
jgi:hypothetical protein